MNELVYTNVRILIVYFGVVVLCGLSVYLTEILDIIQIRWIIYLIYIT